MMPAHYLTSRSLPHLLASLDFLIDKTGGGEADSIRNHLHGVIKMMRWNDNYEKHQAQNSEITINMFINQLLIRLKYESSKNHIALVPPCLMSFLWCPLPYAGPSCPPVPYTPPLLRHLLPTIWKSESLHTFKVPKVPYKPNTQNMLPSGALFLKTRHNICQCITTVFITMTIVSLLLPPGLPSLSSTTSHIINPCH